MRQKATLVLQDEKPTFVLEDGTIIDAEKVGYVSQSYGEHPDDAFYDKFTKDDVSFIQDNNVECEIEMMYEDEENPLPSSIVPRLYKGKIIIHFN